MSFFFFLEQALVGHITTKPVQVALPVATCMDLV